MRENVRDFHERAIKQMMHLTVANEQRYEAAFGRAIKNGDIAPDSKVDYLAMKDFVDGEKYSVSMSTTLVSSAAEGIVKRASFMWCA